MEKFGLEGFTLEGCPCRFWDMLGGQGIPVRITVSDMGPTLLSRLLGLTEAQEGVLNILFRIADAKEVWRSFDELSRETDAACGRAAAELAKRDARAAARPRDGRPLAVRAEQARSASEAIEAARATTRDRARAPRPQKARAR